MPIHYLVKVGKTTETACGLWPEEDYCCSPALHEVGCKNCMNTLRYKHDLREAVREKK